MKKNKWFAAGVVFFCILLLSAGAFGIQFWRLDMVPMKFMIPVLLALGLLAGILGRFLMTRAGKYQKKVSQKGRITAMILSFLLSAGLVMGSVMIQKALDTMQKVTGVPQVSALVDVYVRKEDPSAHIGQLKDYHFGYSTEFEDETSLKAVKELENKLGGAIHVTGFTTYDNMIDALYGGEIGAVLIDNAYLDLIQELGKHKNFEEKVRHVYTCSVTEEAPAPHMTKPAQTEPEGEAEPVNKNTFIMYIGGSDTRSQTLSKKTRNDVNILMAVNTESKEILLVSTPRDYYIPNPARGGRGDKLTHCGISGIENSMEALSQLYKIHVDYYSQINFTGFETLIDALGGVTVSSDYSFTTAAGTYIQKGQNTLTGLEALAFARERYRVPGGDITRGVHQMKVINAVLRKAMSPAVITQYGAIMDSLQGMFYTSMPMEEISELVKMQMSDMAQWSIHSYAMNGKLNARKTASAPGEALSVVDPDQNMVEQAGILFDKLEKGEKITDADVQTQKK